MRVPHIAHKEGRKVHITIVSTLDYPIQLAMITPPASNIKATGRSGADQMTKQRQAFWRGCQENGYYSYK